MFLGGVFNAFQLALRGALSSSIPLAATAGGSAGTSEKIAREGHSHLLPTLRIDPIFSSGGDPIATTSTAGSNIGLKWYAIPAMGAQDALMIDMAFDLSNEGNNKSVQLFHCPTDGTLVGGSSIFAQTFTNTVKGRIMPGYRNKNSTAKQVYLPSLASTSGVADYTRETGAPFWIAVVANITTAGTVSLVSADISIRRGA